MWYNLYLFFSILSSFLESTHIATRIINQNMHVYTRDDLVLETSMEIVNLTTSLDHSENDMLDISKTTVTSKQSKLKFEMPDFSKYVDTVSDKKCMEYIYEMLKRQENNHLKHVPNVTIINGKVVQPAEYPHMGALGWWSNTRPRKLEFLCGASLISDQFLLTAAHCTSVVRENLAHREPDIVRLGTRYLEKSPHELGLDVEIAELIRYRDYSSPYPYFDIALVKLKEKVQFTKFIQPACLSSRRIYEDIKKRITATGWGRVNAKQHDWTTSKELRSTVVHIFNNAVCNFLLNRYKYRFWHGVRPHQVCAGELDGNSDTCQGDSGGPVQYPLVSTSSEGTNHRVLAVTSFGLTKCATQNAPGIYTKVSCFIEWIEPIVWPHEQLTKD